MNSQCPQFWWMINNADKYQYTCLRLAIASNGSKNQRNKRIETFSEAMDAIKAFAIRGDSDDKLRCLVCGIGWLPEGIAINTHQLRNLVSKCKSSINGSLQKMGFTVNLGRTEAANAVTACFPFLKDNTAELRKWSVRRYPTESANTESPIATESNQECKVEVEENGIVRVDQYLEDDTFKITEEPHRVDENWEFQMTDFSYWS